jgi:uncharacterized protein YuzE
MMAFPTIAGDPEHATIYLEFSDTDLHKTVELSRGVYLDVDEEGQTVGLEILQQIRIWLPASPRCRRRPRSRTC